MCTDLMMGSHQPGNSFAATVPPGSGQFGVHTRRPVGAVRALVDHRDRLTQLRVDGLPRRGRSGDEGVEARPGNREDST